MSVCVCVCVCVVCVCGVGGVYVCVCVCVCVVCSVCVWCVCSILNYVYAYLLYVSLTEGVCSSLAGQHRRWFAHTWTVCASGQEF